MVGRDPAVRVAAAPGEQGRVETAARNAADAVPVVRTGPTAVTAAEPLLLLTHDGRTALFGDPAASTVTERVETLDSGELPTDGADAVVEHDPGTGTLPAPADGPLAVGRRSVLGPCGWVDPLAPADLDPVSPERDAGAVADIGIRGRGRGDAAADDPVGPVWETVRGADGDPVVVVNANESWRDQRADRLLLAAAPVAVLDGVAAVAEYVGAADAVLHVNEADTDLQRHLGEALDAAGDALSVVPQLTAGPDEYRAGAPTAALEALEGADRIEPRLQPPTPAEHGLYGRPTVVHTPRTFAQVAHALRDPDAVDADAADPGTRLFTVCGDVAAPATVELPSDASLETALGAVEPTSQVKMACVGGALGGYTRDLDLAPTAGSLRGADLGTDGVVELHHDGRCPLADAGERAQFAATENSGRCVPGREGTKQLAELLRDVYDGELADGKIRELARVMRRSSNCRIGAEAPRPVTTALEEFEPEIRAHADGRCPTGTCTTEL